MQNLRVHNWEILILRLAPLVRCHAEMETEIFRDMHYERSYLVHNVELR